MKDLLYYIVSNLVDHPEAIQIDEIEKDAETVLELRVAKDDMGKVIGRQGRIAKEIRTIMKSAATRTDRHVTVEIVG